MAKLETVTATDPGLAELPYASNSAALQRAIAAKLTGQDAEAEAAILLALATGLGDSVMAGMRSPDEAIALLDHQLARIGL